MCEREMGGLREREGRRERVHMEVRGQVWGLNSACQPGSKSLDQLSHLTGPQTIIFAHCKESTQATRLQSKVYILCHLVGLQCNSHGCVPPPLLPLLVSTSPAPKTYCYYCSPHCFIFPQHKKHLRPTRPLGLSILLVAMLFL